MNNLFEIVAGIGLVVFSAVVGFLKAKADRAVKSKKEAEEKARLAEHEAERLKLQAQKQKELDEAAKKASKSIKKAKDKIEQSMEPIKAEAGEANNEPKKQQKVINDASDLFNASR